jgi:chlorite dismutase
MSSSDDATNMPVAPAREGTEFTDAAEGIVPPAFTLFAVFRISSTRPTVFDGRDVAGAVRELEDVTRLVEQENVTVRGWYDVSGMRSDGDLMVWLHGTTVENLQWALRELRRTAVVRPLIRVWGAVGVHRPDEFMSTQAPAFVQGVAPKQWLTVYPFVRSADWYLLDTAEHRRLLAEHQRASASFTGVSANTVAAFALNDYEWLVPLESDEVTDLVDMTRALRSTDARLHLGVDTPCFTGRRIEPAEIVEVVQ